MTLTEAVTGMNKLNHGLLERMHDAMHQEGKAFIMDAQANVFDRLRANGRSDDREMFILSCELLGMNIAIATDPLIGVAMKAGK